VSVVANRHDLVVRWGGGEPAPPFFKRNHSMLTNLSRQERKHLLQHMRDFLKGHGIKRVSNDPHKREQQYRRLIAQLGMELVQNEQGRLEVKPK